MNANYSGRTRTQSPHGGGLEIAVAEKQHLAADEGRSGKESRANETSKQTKEQVDEEEGGKRGSEQERERE